MDNQNSETGGRQLLPVDGGHIAFTVEGSGPPIVCLPGMGDLRTSYRHITPQLVAAGYQVICTDLRGHGDSGAKFAKYGDEATARDLLAQLEGLNAPAVVIGNSMSAGAAVIAAARRPDLFRALVLVGPFVRNPPTQGPMQRLLLRIALAWPWTRLMWNLYLPLLYAGEKPADFEQYRKDISTALKRPGYARAFKLTARTSHDLAEQLLPTITLPTLVIMGDQDPDFASPHGEAQWIAESVGGTIAMILNAGHYPHAQQPENTTHAILEFLKENPHD